MKRRQGSSLHQISSDFFKSILIHHLHGKSCVAVIIPLMYIGCEAKPCELAELSRFLHRGILCRFITCILSRQQTNENTRTHPFTTAQQGNIKTLKIALANSDRCSAEHWNEDCRFYLMSYCVVMLGRYHCMTGMENRNDYSV